jgi:hypothetical protein
MLNTARKTIYSSFFIFNFSFLFFFASCSDVKELDAGYVERYTNAGPPSISAIYDVQDTAFATPLTGGVLNQYIRIKGQNLAHPVRIVIDGLETDMDTRVYAESGDAYIRIPRYVPEQKTGNLYYETELGVAQVAYNVSIPEVQLDGLVNEFCFAGTRAQLAGDYFDLYSFGDTTDASPVSIVVHQDAEGYRKVIHCDSCTETFTSIIIPADCPDDALITFTWPRMGGGETTRTIPFRPVSRMLFGNFDGDMGWWNDMGKEWLAACTAPGAPASQGYNFLRLAGTFAPWDWDISGFGCNWPFDIALDDVDDYWFKFEVNTAPTTPFLNYGDAGKYGVKNGGYRLTLAGAPVRGQFDPVSDGITNTNGKWITIRMPLSELVEGLEAMPKVGDWVSLEFGTQPNTADDWVIDHSFAQFRIEPKEY